MGISSINVPSTVKKSPWGLVGKIGGGVAGAVGGFFAGGPGGVIPGATAGAQVGGTVGSAAAPPKVEEGHGVSTMDRAMKMDPQAQIAALDSGISAARGDMNTPIEEMNARVNYMEEAKRRLRERTG